MFTGIIECLGLIILVQFFKGQRRLRIKPLIDGVKFKKGESIAVNGVCLTVENFTNDWFEAYCSLETLNLTNLGDLQNNHLVNLEFALTLDKKISGHFVSGHIDALAKVTQISVADKSKIFHLTFNQQFGKYFVPKCSVALDGISLTVNRCGTDFIEVNIIPETLRETIIAKWQIGYFANMEIDMVSKYLQRNNETNLGSLINQCFGGAQ